MNVELEDRKIKHRALIRRTNNWYETVAVDNVSKISSILKFEKVLEVGSFEGGSTIHLMQLIEMHGGGELFCVDKWSRDGDHIKIDMSDAEVAFDHNVACTKELLAPSVMVRKLKGRSIRQLAGLIDRDYAASFDFIYIDGSHRMRDVLMDGMLCYELLKVGGICLFDNYLFNFEDEAIRGPKHGIDTFFRFHSDNVQIIINGYQIAYQKTDGNLSVLG